MAGDEGTEQTIRHMRALIDDAWKDSVVNRTAIDVIRAAGARPYDSWAQVRAIYNFAHGFYFVNDPLTKEALRPTRELLKLGAGDCDDINGILLPSLLGSLGFEVRLVTIAADAQMPENFSHVYCEVFVDGAWYPLDAARPDASFGVAPPSYFRREWWSLTDSEHGEYSDGLSGLAGGRYSLRGLGQAPSSAILMSENGQAVQQAVQGVIGPGGAIQASRPNNPGNKNLGTNLVLLGLGLFIAWRVLS